MKRRNFLRNIAALAAAPALPLKLGAAPLPVSAEQYAKAVHWAGLWVHSTAATYKNMLGVDQAVGEAVFKRLQSDGVVGLMDASGIARAAVPHYELPEVAARLRQTLAPKGVNLGASAEASKSGKLDLNKISKRLEGEEAEEASLESADQVIEDELENCERPEPRPVEEAEEAVHFDAV